MSLPIPMFCMPTNDLDMRLTHVDVDDGQEHHTNSCKLNFSENQSVSIEEAHIVPLTGVFLVLNVRRK